MKLALGADGLGHPGREFRRVIVGHAQVGGPLAGENRVGRLSGHLAKHDRHATILRRAGTARDLVVTTGAPSAPFAVASGLGGVAGR